MAEGRFSPSHTRTGRLPALGACACRVISHLRSSPQRWNGGISFAMFRAVSCLRCMCSDLAAHCPAAFERIFAVHLVLWCSV